MEEHVSLGGPVEKLGEEFVLRIPLEAGGDILHQNARQISRIDGEFLVVPIPSWLAEKLGIGEGSEVIVDNRDGKFNLTVAPLS
jgi:hypothetical protein